MLISAEEETPRPDLLSVNNQAYTDAAPAEQVTKAKARAAAQDIGIR